MNIFRDTMNDKTDLSKLNLQATLRIDALYYHFALETYNGVQSAERQYNRKISSITPLISMKFRLNRTHPKRRMKSCRKGSKSNVELERNMENYCNSLPLFIYSVPHLLKHTLTSDRKIFLRGRQ